VERRAETHHRPLPERALSMQISVRVILSVLAASPERLTAKQLWQRTGYLEMKTRKFLTILRRDGMVDFRRGGAGAHGCLYRVCRCHGCGIMAAGRAYLEVEELKTGDLPAPTCSHRTA
jgi:hypothetical protein